VENILIEQAFKIERLFTASPMEKMGQFVMVDYGTPYGYYPQQYCMGSYYPYYGEMAYQQPYLNPYIPYPECMP
jgi:hypothetical protein